MRRWPNSFCPPLEAKNHSWLLHIGYGFQFFYYREEISAIVRIHFRVEPPREKTAAVPPPCLPLEHNKLRCVLGAAFWYSA